MIRSLKRQQKTLHNDGALCELWVSKQWNTDISIV